MPDVVIIGAVVDEQTLADAHLVGSQPHTVGAVHGFVHVLDELTQLGDVLGHRLGRSVENGVSGNHNGTDSHVADSTRRPSFLNRLVMSGVLETLGDVGSGM